MIPRQPYGVDKNSGLRAVRNHEKIFSKVENKAFEPINDSDFSLLLYFSQSHYIFILESNVVLQCQDLPYIPVKL